MTIVRLCSTATRRRPRPCDQQCEVLQQRRPLEHDRALAHDAEALEPVAVDGVLAQEHPALLGVHPGVAAKSVQELIALAKKNAAKSANLEKKLKKKTYDATLDVTRPEDPPDDSEADAIFREMKKREF